MEPITVPAVATHRLRVEALCWPEPSIAIDEGATHLAVTGPAGDIVAVVSHSPWPCPDEPGTPARYFWAMAVDAAHRGRGLGRRLLTAVRAEARAQGEQLTWADARETAVPFYLACGAELIGPPYLDPITARTDRRVAFRL